MSETPMPIKNWLASLPDDNVGTLHAKIKPPSPLSGIGLWYKVDGWGQLCDGRDHRDMVHLMLYNKFPNHGKGWTYVAWKAEPDNPEKCKHPRSGEVENPKPYSGITYE